MKIPSQRVPLMIDFAYYEIENGLDLNGCFKVKKQQLKVAQFMILDIFPKWKQNLENLYLRQYFHHLASSKSELQVGKIQYCIEG